MRAASYGPTDYLQEEVLPALHERLDMAFPEFGWKRRRRGWEATNQEHLNALLKGRAKRVFAQSPRGFFVDGAEARSWLSHVNGGRSPRGKEILSAARTLAALAGVDVAVLDRDLLQGEGERFAQTERRRDLLTAFWVQTRSALFSSKGRYARSFLAEKRGFTTEDLEELPLGVYTTPDEILEHLDGLRFGADEAVAAGLVPGPDGLNSEELQCWPGRLVGLWCDRFGNPDSVWAVDLLKTKGASGALPTMDALESFLTTDVDGAPPTGPEYMYLPGTEKNALVACGLDEALRSPEGHENLVLMERPLEALYLQMRGLPNVAAICGFGAELGRERWEGLAGLGVKSVTLALANDLLPDGSWPGRDGALSAVEASASIPNAPVAYVVDPADLGAALDIAELVRDARGDLAPLKELLKKRHHGFRYKALLLVEKHRPGSDWTDAGKASAVDEAVDFDGSVTVRDKFPDLDLFFWPEILEKTGAGVEAVRARRDAVREKRGRETLRRAYEELLAEAGKTLKTRRIEDVRGLLRERVEQIQADERAMRADPVRSVADELALHDARLAPFRGGELLGLPQRTLRSLDLATLGLRGLVLLAGAPSSGKTAFALQMALDVVRASPDAAALFLSLDMPRWDLMSRLLSSLSGLDWKTLVFGSTRGVTGPSTPFKVEEISAIHDAQKRLHELGQRIRILDSSNFPEVSVDRLLDQVDEMRSRTGSKHVLLVVDHLQAWPLGGRAMPGAHTDAEGDRFRVGAMKTLRDALDGAVLVVSEARRHAAGDGWTASFADPIGSFRGAATPDIVLLLRAYTDQELAGAFKLTRERDGKAEIDPAKVAELKESSRTQGKSYGKLEVAKGRDGVLRGTIDVTFWYRRSRFEEGRR